MSLIITHKTNVNKNNYKKDTPPPIFLYKKKS